MNLSVERCFQELLPFNRCIRTVQFDNNNNNNVYFHPQERRSNGITIYRENLKIRRTKGTLCINYF